MNSRNSIKQKYRTAIIGAGPAGLAAAVQLIEKGVSDFILIEREAETGGILNQCIHNGFGLKIFKEDLTGPEFAQRLRSQLSVLMKQQQPGKKPCILMNSMVISLAETDSKVFSLRIHSKDNGIIEIKADSVITTTGCRERTRENIEVPGSRPAGIYTAGQAQNLINRRHYSIGRRVIIQGSGDIGLIMARRLTIEGFKVAAVLERLPYLSGSIRNKVQCLDHFNIPLLLSRRITDIRGKNRVHEVETSALDGHFTPVSGTEETVSCDTVLFAAGLIPELETVKTAGVNLPDNFHPEANKLFETNIPGIFSAGNCLHINDLADSAAEEGIAAAGNVIEFLNSPAEFRLRAESAETAGKLPYKRPLPNYELNEAYFKHIKNENLTVCIVCPKGCLLSEGNFGCRRGEEYWTRTFSSGSTVNYMQRAHTTIENSDKISSSAHIYPVISENEIPVKYIDEAVKAVKKEGRLLSDTDSVISVSAGGSSYRFTLCRPAEQD